MDECRKHNKSFCCQCTYGIIAESNYPISDTVTDLQKPISRKLKDFLILETQYAFEGGVI